MSKKSDPKIHHRRSIHLKEYDYSQAGAYYITIKAAVTRRAGRELDSANIWQRDYYEHILRDNNDYVRVAGYIFANPANWNDDKENPKNAMIRVL